MSVSLIDEPLSEDAANLSKSYISDILSRSLRSTIDNIRLSVSIIADDTSSEHDDEEGRDSTQKDYLTSKDINDFDSGHKM
eukprot:UC4_evm1s850